jgi:RNA polymerase sigma-70 factor (ECF subfamily)
VDRTEETALLRKCREGDPGSWNDLFDLHYDPACRFIFQLGYDLTREDAEEIAQEAFVSVIRNLDTFKFESRFQTWLFRIAANKARDFIERKSAVKRNSGRQLVSIHAENADGSLAIDPASDAPGPEALLLKQEQASLTYEALKQLDAPCREIIDLRYFGDLSYEEISALLQLNPKTVSSRLSKCLAKLAEIAKDIFARGERAASPSNL